MKNEILIGCLNFFVFTLTVMLVFGIYWLGGGDFHRSVILAFTSIVSLSFGLLALRILAELMIDDTIDPQVGDVKQEQEKGMYVQGNNGKYYEIEYISKYDYRLKKR